jgi:WD40 repeat protein
MWIQKVPAGGIDGLAYSPDGRTLYTAARGGTFASWDTATHQSRTLCYAPGASTRGLVTSGRLLIARRYPHVLAWDLATGAEIGRLSPSVPYDALPIPGDDGRVLYRSDDRRSLFVWEPERGSVNAAFAGPFSSEIRAFDLSPDAQTIAIAEGASHIVKLFDLTARAIPTQDPVFWSGFVWGIRFSPDGRLLAVFAGGHIHLCEVPSLTWRGEPVNINNRHGEATFAFHPTAPVFVALNPEKHLTLFSSETGEAIRSFDFALGRYVRCAAFSPDGLTCAVGGSNKQFAVFDVDL